MLHIDGIFIKFVTYKHEKNFLNNIAKLCVIKQLLYIYTYNLLINRIFIYFYKLFRKLWSLKKMKHKRVQYESKAII